MNKYINDSKLIKATEKAYNTVYKTQGYVPYIEEKPKSNTKKKEEADK